MNLCTANSGKAWIMQINHFAATCLLAVAVTACDSPRGPAVKLDATPIQPRPEKNEESALGAPQGSLSSELAHMYLGLVQDSRFRPESNAVDTYAKAFKWKAMSPEMNALANAKHGYVGKVAGSTVLLGSDGSNDIFSIAVNENFEPAAILNSMQQAVTARKVGDQESMGQTFEIYRITDGATELGFMSLTYSHVPSLRGIGTVGYISAARARKEGIGVN